MTGKTEDTVELGEMENSLGLLLRLAQVKNFNAFYEFMNNGLSPGELTVLWVVGLNPGMRQGTIARRLLIKAAHMTKLVNRLVRNGLLERLDTPEDRRSVFLTLTKDGRAIVNRHKRQLAKLHQTERAALSASEYRQFISLLKKYTGSGNTQ